MVDHCTSDFPPGTMVDHCTRHSNRDSSLMYAGIGCNLPQNFIKAATEETVAQSVVSAQVHLDSLRLRPSSVQTDMEPERGENGPAAAAGRLLANGAGKSEQLEKGLLARMPPMIVDACIAKMSVINVPPGDVIIERDTLGTSMVRPSQPRPRKFVTLCNR